MSFFAPGLVSDPAYTNVRDLGHLADARLFVEQLWTQYQGFEDANFLTDAQSHFLQRFWEMYLTCALRHRNLDLTRIGSSGPESYFWYDGRRVWVEAIAPNAGQGADRVPEITLGEMYSVPIDKILLRFTSALKEKKEKWQEALDRGDVGSRDLLLLAINSRGIPHAPFGGEMPYFLKAFLPIGQLALEIDRRDPTANRWHHQYRPSLSKLSGAVVPTDTFLSKDSSSIVGVLHSGVDCVNRPDQLGDDFVVLHNPSSAVALPTSLFSWCRQYVWDDFKLTRISERQ